MDERVWRLPGPRGLVLDSVAEYGRRRHVAIVLPRELATNTEFTEGLALSLINELQSQTVEARRVLPDTDAHSLLDTLSRSLVFDDSPATVTDLLRHQEAVGCVAVLVAADLSLNCQIEVAELLRRLEAESRSLPPTERLTLVVIIGRDRLPEFAGRESSDVTVATVWWWNRIARWDVAAHVSDRARSTNGGRVVSDVRAETIVEVARWDLDLADYLCDNWRGDPGELQEVLMGRQEPEDRNVDFVAGPCGVRPGEDVQELWDDGLIDGWHDSHSLASWASISSGAQINRAVWAAQARILLPWIEERRERLHQRAIARIGRDKFRAALQELFDPPLCDDGVIEIGPLRRLIDIRIGNVDAVLRSAARRLAAARNRLAHLEPLGLPELNELVAACRSLN